MSLIASPAMVPLVVTAYLRGGVSTELPDPLDLAGILAASHHERVSADTVTVLPDTTGEEPDDFALPLAVCPGDGDEQWHWAASCARLNDHDGTYDPRPYTKTVDAAWAANVATKVPAIHPNKGPYRDARSASPVLPCTSLTWWCVGDPEKINGLLSTVRAVGKRRHVGEGVVLCWDVTPRGGEADAFMWAHLEPDTTRLHRPVPAACAQTVGATEVTPVWYAIRPPSWHPDRLCELVHTQTESWDEDDFAW